MKTMLLMLLIAVPAWTGEGPAPASGVQWREWNREAFKEASERARPIALVVSCRWAQTACLLDEKTLRDDALIHLLNERFVPIRIDRDRRPDIDVRYQAAVRALTGVSGWPLVVFLTPEGQVLLGGTFSRRNDDLVREQPGLLTVTEHVSSNWSDRRRELTTKASQFEKELDVDDLSTAADPPADLFDRSAAVIRSILVPPSTWVGPRFPQPSAIELLVAHARRNKSAESLAVARTYLDGMLDGSIHDRVNGGFHRFTADRNWRLPRFEKLLTTNAEMLHALARMFQATREPRYREAAERTIEWAMTTLADRVRGGFGASQAAGTDPEDPGMYYTWTVGEIERVLRDDLQCRLFSRVCEIGEWGDLPELAPHRNVLFVAVQLEEAAKSLRIPGEKAAALLADAHLKLRAAYMKRAAPPVDPTLLVDANARMVSALLACASAFEKPEFRALALKTLDRLLQEGVDRKRGAAHILVTDGEAVFPCLASDEAALAVACLDAADATDRVAYVDAAREALARLEQRFRDPKTGAFLDRPVDYEKAPPALGRLTEPQRPFTDTPGPSVNALAAEALFRLGVRRNDETCTVRARAVVHAFGAVLDRMGPSAAALVLVAEEVRAKTP